MDNGPFAQMRSLKIGDSIIWDESRRRGVYAIAKAVNISVQVRKHGKDEIKITRISQLDKPRLVCCSECGNRYYKRSEVGWDI